MPLNELAKAILIYAKILILQNRKIPKLKEQSKPFGGLRQGDLVQSGISIRTTNRTPAEEGMIMQRPSDRGS